MQESGVRKRKKIMGEVVSRRGRKGVEGGAWCPEELMRRGARKWGPEEGKKGGQKS